MVTESQGRMEETLLHPVPCNSSLNRAKSILSPKPFFFISLLDIFDAFYLIL